MKFFSSSSLFFCTLLVGSCFALKETIIDVMKKDSSISIVTKILEKRFKSVSFDPNNVPYTLFVPTNNAIINSGADKLSESQIISILGYHVVNETIFSKDIKRDIKFYRTFQLEKEYVNLPGGKSQVLGLFRSGSKVIIKDGIFDPSERPARVIKANVKAAKGVIHIIDKVLKIPPKISTILKGSPRFSVLRKELMDSNLLSVIDNTPGITLFAPSNLAFTKLLQTNIDPSIKNLIPVLKNHVIGGKSLYSTKFTRSKSYETLLSGSKVQVSRSRIGLPLVQNRPIIAQDLLAENGVLQGINFVIIPDKRVYTPRKKTGNTSKQ
ncbi:Transforming growth factor-beta-induced protein ig-h3 [Smittium mucronatum]|uniref:Transforming growth factor-beta-induced protein ig-h3 n=1 Tax=Smittium mucronatum TaxID=133383 RepID=A0A1R0H7U0_9FUNG|nr:Transforming growth factor-beta-induced protein ig-h3 [Smittium mucronatum]